MKNKHAIVVLTRGYDTLDKYSVLINRNNSIYDKILKETDTQFDIIIYHEGNILDNHQEHIQRNSMMPLIFKNIKTSYPGTAFDNSKNIMNYELCPPTELSDRFEIGYKHMCQFWAIDIIDYLCDEYKYIIRIDEDVIIKKYTPGLFDSIIGNNIKFSVPYIYGHLDDPNVIVGLEKLTTDFINKNNVVTDIPFSDVGGILTNFMMLDLQYFKNNKLVCDFLSEVEKAHGIYSNRWGDAPTWSIIAYYLMGDEQIALLDDIEYLHLSHGSYINGKGV